MLEFEITIYRADEQGIYDMLHEDNSNTVFGFLFDKCDVVHPCYGIRSKSGSKLGLGDDRLRDMRQACCYGRGKC